MTALDHPAVRDHDFLAVYRGAARAMVDLRLRREPRLRLRRMTAGELAAFQARRLDAYATEQVRAGNWSADVAEVRAAEETAKLLPKGADTPGMLLLTAETEDGALVGYVWVALERPDDAGGGAWIYDIEVVAGQRGKGYGRALLAAAEREAARRGAGSIGLQVFGSNDVARGLYESAGYEASSLRLRKRLRP